MKTDPSAELYATEPQSLSDRTFVENPPGLVSGAPLPAATATSTSATLGFLVVFHVRVDKYRHGFDPGGDVAALALIVTRFVVDPGTISACATLAGSIVVIINLGVFATTAAGRLIRHRLASRFVSIPAPSASAPPANHFGLGIVFVIIVKARLLDAVLDCLCITSGFAVTTTAASTPTSSTA